jgi:hypothetical protein
VVRFQIDVKDISLAHNGLVAHPVSCTVTEVCLFGSKAARAWSWPLTSSHCRGHALLSLCGMVERQLCHTSHCAAVNAMLTLTCFQWEAASALYVSTGQRTWRGGHSLQVHGLMQLPCNGWLWVSVLGCLECSGISQLFSNPWNFLLQCRSLYCSGKFLLVLASAVILDPGPGGPHEHICVTVLEVEVEVELRPAVSSASLSWCQAPIWDQRPIFLSPWNVI